MPVAFDTLTYAKKLRDAGFTQEQAEVQAHALADIVEERLATKQDIATLHRNIKELETSLRHDIKELETSLQRDMKDMEYRMTIRLGTMLAVSITIMGALVKLL